VTTETDTEPKLLHEDSTMVPWRPIRDQVQIAALGKLLEECGEVESAAARCIIQGVDEKDPTTGVVNAERLTKELADLFAASTLAANVLGLNVPFIAQRSNRKTSHFRRWIELLKGQGDGHS
jgi:NTP pyrophosphatase (non-canonical NTP hydrolase)